MNGYWKDKKVCVTGGTGFLGYHLVQRLLAEGANVRVFGLPPRASHPMHQLKQVDFQFGDVLDASAIRKALDDREVIFHAAGNVATRGPGLKSMQAIHTEGTRNVLECMNQGSRLVHTSSVVTIGASRGQILDESSPFNLDQCKIDYVFAKKEAERIAIHYSQQSKHVVVVNPGYLIGPDDYDHSIMGEFCTRFWRGLMPCVPPGGFNLVDVRDVAQGHLLAAQFGKPGTRYILGGDNALMAEFCTRLAEVARLRPRAMPRISPWLLGKVTGLCEFLFRNRTSESVPSRQQARVSSFHWYYSSAKAKAELGYTFRPLIQSIAETYQWHINHKPMRWKGFRKWWWRPVLSLPSCEQIQQATKTTLPQPDLS